MALRKLSHMLRQLVETRLLGTRIQELIWKTRHIYKGSHWARTGLDTIDHPHRALVVEAVRAFAPLKTVLEVGCSSGPNLYLLARALPDAQLYGIDINPRVIDVGRQWMLESGINNVSLSVARAESLDLFGERSMDVVLTDATLMYVGPDRIEQVLASILRVARKGVVCVEWHTNSTPKNQTSTYYDGHWVHHFDLLLERIVGRDKVCLTELPPQAFGDDCWGRFGTIISVRL